MSKVKKCIFLLLLAVVTVCMLTACNRKKPEEDGMKIIFSEKILGIAEITPEEWVEDLIAFSDENYVDVYVNDDGASVTLEISEEQRDYWITSIADTLDELKNRFAQLGTGFQIKYSEAYSYIDMYYNLELDAYDAIYYVIYTEVLCIDQQLFMGVGHDEWAVSFNIYNSDTGKLVTSGDSDTGLSYTESDWAASM